MRSREQPRPPSGVLASALVDALAADPAAIARLRQLVGTDPSVASAPEPSVYTVSSLASVLGVSARVVRGAIVRGELVAAKRGGRYIISARAVDAWAAGDKREASSEARQGRVRVVRRHGPLRTALDALGETTASSFERAAARG
jgi:excisionase family DNA binding protein